MKKIKKSQALYIERPNTQYQCKDCVYFRMFMNAPRCALFKQHEIIKEIGTCGLWQPKSEVLLSTPWFVTSSKIESGYEENKEGFSCKRCEEFTENDCKKIDKNSPGDSKGTISKDGCCNFWDKDDERGNMKTEEFK